MFHSVPSPGQMPLHTALQCHHSFIQPSPVLLRDCRFLPRAPSSCRLRLSTRWQTTDRPVTHANLWRRPIQARQELPADSIPSSTTPPRPSTPPAIPTTVNPLKTTAARNLPDKWAVAIAASIIHALHATAVYTVPSTLLAPMRKSLNLSMSQIATPLVVYRLVQTFLLLPAGFVLNAIGPQLSLRLSMTSAALLAPLLTFSTSLSHLIVLQVLFSFTKLFGGLSALLLITSRAFHADNGGGDGDSGSVDASGNSSSAGVGTATSIVLSGYSLAGFIAPAFIGTAADLWGWRFSAFVLAIFFAVAAVPLTWHYMRDVIPPPSLQQQVRTAWQQFRTRGQRRQSVEEKEAQQVEAAEVRRRDPLFTLPYSLIFIAVAAFSFSMHFVFDHFIVFLNEDLLMPFSIATRYMSLLHLSSLAGKLSIGPLSDRFNKSWLISIYGVVGILASFLLLDFTAPLSFVATASIAKVIAFTFFYSMSYGSIFSLTTSILPEFGMRQMALRSNLNLMSLFAGGSAGSYVTAAWRSSRGSYKWPFVWNVVAFSIVTACGLLKLALERIHVREQSQPKPALATGGEAGPRQ